jgi:mono/diheme cytochrome c family protein
MTGRQVTQWTTWLRWREAACAAAAGVAAMAGLHATAQTMLGEAQQGQELARTVCAECHSVDRGDDLGGVAGAPSFQEIADRPSTTELSLRAFLRTSHAGMPDLVLTEPEVDDIAAYILSLR